MGGGPLLWFWLFGAGLPRDRQGIYVV